MEIIAIAVNKQGGRHVALVNHVGVPWNVTSVDQSTDPILLEDGHAFTRYHQ